ncbi:hypothetical protein [Planococcus beigongshangi]|uniref:hypothetical protein n=1 Tax=Planococcus beigongshangi TaxID=2782536 RepID=UPI00193C60FE|nr:hypothetical protein [Planococcus beigongshangi]
MNQLRGLMMKDWTIIKGYMLLAFLLDIVIPLGAASLYRTEFYEGLLVFCGTMMALHILLPIILLSILFTKEMDHPDIFFHSTASIHKINASKFGIAFFVTCLSLLWMSILTFAFTLIAPEVFDMDELLLFGAAFIAGILFFSVFVSIIYYFYLTMFYTMKPKIGGFAYIVSIGLFIFGLEMWDRIAATELYAAITGFWVIQVSESDLLTRLSYGLMVSFGEPPTIQMGQLLISLLLLSGLYLLSARWFEKKVRA